MSEYVFQIEASCLSPLPIKLSVSEICFLLCKFPIVKWSGLLSIFVSHGVLWLMCLALIVSVRPFSAWLVLGSLLSHTSVPSLGFIARVTHVRCYSDCLFEAGTEIVRER